MDRFEISIDKVGAQLVQIRNLADGTECWVPRSKLRRHDGAWVLRAEREQELREAIRKRQAAKAAETKSEVAA